MDRAPALTEGLRILELVAHGTGPAPLEALVDKVDMSRSSVKRILRILVGGGYLRRLVNRGGYSAGPRLLSLADACRESVAISEETERVLRRAAETLDMSVQYGLLDRSRQRPIVLHTVELMGTVHVAPPGTDMSPYCHRHALAKMILAQADPDVRRRILARSDGQRRTEHTILPGPELDRVLDRAARNGIVVDREELRLGLFRVAVPVGKLGNPDGGAVCATCFASSFTTEQEQSIADRLRECARQVASLWGGVGASPQDVASVDHC